MRKGRVPGTGLLKGFSSVSTISVRLKTHLCWGSIDFVAVWWLAGGLVAFTWVTRTFPLSLVKNAWNFFTLVVGKEELRWTTYLDVFWKHRRDFQAVPDEGVELVGRKKIGFRWISRRDSLVPAHSDKLHTSYVLFIRLRWFWSSFSGSISMFWMERHQRIVLIARGCRRSVRLGDLVGSGVNARPFPAKKSDVPFRTQGRRLFMQIRCHHAGRKRNSVSCKCRGRLFRITSILQGRFLFRISLCKWCC